MPVSLLHVLHMCLHCHVILFNCCHILVLLFRVKYLYRKIHVQHHVLEGDLNVFGTADMHLVEAFFLTMSYYALYLTVGTAMVSAVCS